MSSQKSEKIVKNRKGVNYKKAHQKALTEAQELDAEVKEALARAEKKRKEKADKKKERREIDKRFLSHHKISYHDKKSYDEGNEVKKAAAQAAHALQSVMQQLLSGSKNWQWSEIIRHHWKKAIRLFTDVNNEVFTMFSEPLTLEQLKQHRQNIDDFLYELTISLKIIAKGLEDVRLHSR